MKRIAFILIATLFLAISCKKRSTPFKVRRTMVENTFVISRFVDNGVNITTDFSGTTLFFGEDRTISISPDDTLVAAYSIPDNASNPTNVIFYLPDTNKFAPLSDDWSVVFITGKEFRLERLNGQKSEGDQLIFSKI
ncbi:MAG: hypothetical protein ACI9XP_000588 [Lentimonas sp.]|jgi:hypothetical protein